MQFLVWLVQGLITGWIIGQIMSYEKRDAKRDLVAGVAGAVMGGSLATVAHPTVTSAIIYNALAALLGALVLTVITVIARDSSASAKSA